MTEVTNERRIEAEIERLKDLIDGNVLRMRDLNIFICAKSIGNEDLKKFTKAYADLSHQIDEIENAIAKLQRKGK